jgi:asparagine synthase (glutamine-hydrolysing)
LCGIAGFTHLNRRPPEADRIWELTRALTHRGPDQQDVWDSPYVSLGAVRLKIIDLEHGRQPMCSEDGDTVLVFNGEIYNHNELRHELTALGHHFRSRCDTEVVLRAFLQWDTDAFSRLRGMFGLAIWTESNRRLVLARDRMGIKPLYFARSNDDLLFGSELKTILLHPGFDRRLNMAGLWHYLSLNYVPGPHTLVEGIEKLHPGNWLEWKNGRIQMEPYWKLKFKPDSSITLPDAKAELDNLLRESVQEHLLSDVPLGVWSSGGLDSSTILHYASEASANRLKSFSISFRGREFDESRYFREIAERYQTEHRELDLNPDVELRGAIEEFATYSDEPSADAGALPVWFLSKLCRREVTVALSGDGADELFGGYNTYRADNYKRRMKFVPRGLLRLSADLAKRLPVSSTKVGFDYKLQRFLDGSLKQPELAHFHWNGTFSQSEKRLLLEDAGMCPRVPLFVPDNASGNLNRFLWTDQLYYLPDDILYKCDRMSMAHSLEVRPPFLDHRIVEFAARLPENFKIRGGKLKYILRELMKDRLPGSVLSRQKEGFDIPAHDWLRTTLRPLLLDVLNERDVRESGIFSCTTVRQLISSHLERRVNVGYHLWGLMILFLWMKKWGIQPPSSTMEPMVSVSAIS